MGTINREDKIDLVGHAKTVEEYINLLEDTIEDFSTRIDKAIEYIESNPLVYYGDYDIRVNDIQQQESSCEELKFIETLTKILRGENK